MVLTNGLFSTTLLSGLIVDYSVNIEKYFSYTLVVIYVTLNVKPPKKCMYFWVPIIACPKLTSLYINYTTNEFVPVVRKRILDILLSVTTSSLREYFLV